MLCAFPWGHADVYTHGAACRRPTDGARFSSPGEGPGRAGGRRAGGQEGEKDAALLSVGAA